MSVLAQVERWLRPGLGTCGECGRPWQHPTGHPIGVREHVTTYDGSSGCFPLCEGCWSKLTPDVRQPYYDALVDHWIRLHPDERAGYEKKRKLIEAAVSAGR